MLKRLFTAFLLFFSFSGIHAQNLINNGSAELPVLPINGWTTVSGNWSQSTWVPPQDGSYHFFAGQSAVSEIYQDIDVSPGAIFIDLGGATFNFSGYIRSWDDVGLDQSRIRVEYRGAVNNLLGFYDSGNQTSIGTGATQADRNSSTDGWLQLTDSRVAPIGTRTIRIRLIATRVHGSDNDGYFDNLSLTVNCEAGNINVLSSNPMCEGDVANLELQAFVGLIQWQRSYNNGAFMDFGTGLQTVSDSPTPADAPSKYRAVVSYGTCSDVTAEVEIQISDINGGTVMPSVTSLCETTPVELTLSGHSATSIQWQYSTDNITFTDFGSGANPQMHIAPTNGTYYYRAQVGKDGCTDYSDTTTVVVNPQAVAGTISSLPASICEGQSIDLSISGQTGTIQWQESTDGGSIWTPIGTGNTTETIIPTASNSMFKASIGSGSCAATTNVISPTIQAAADAGTFLLTPNPICDGDVANLSTSGYTGNTFQWQVSNDAGTSWTDFGPDADATTVSPNSGSSPLVYRAIVTNGSCSDTTSEETLVINPTAVGGTATISTNTICEGENANLTLTGSAGAIEWFVSTNGGTVWTTTGLTSANETVSPPLGATYMYRANLVAGSCGAVSNRVTLNVIPNVTPGTISSDVSQTCDGETITFTLAGNSATTITWQKSLDNGATWISFGGTTNSQTDNPDASVASVRYRAAISNGTCTAYTNELIQSISPYPSKGVLVLSAASVCEGQDVVLSTSSTGTIDWQYRNNGSLAWTASGITGNNYTANPLVTNSPIEYRAVFSLGICGDTSAVETVTVSPSPTAGTISPTTSNVCENEELILSLSGQSTGTIDWQQSTNAGGSWSNTGETSDMLTVSNLTPTDYQYRVVLTLGTCYDTSSAATVSVQPKPTFGNVVTSSTTICEGEPLTVSLQVFTGSIASWEASLDNGTTWITGGPPLNQITASPPYLGIPVLFRGIAQLGSCYDTTAVSTINVNQKPNAGTLSISDPALCDYATTTATTTGSTGNIIWRESLNNMFWSTRPETTSSITIIPNSNTPRYFKVIADNGGCKDTSNVEVLNTISVDAGLLLFNSNICRGTSIKPSLLVPGSTLSNEWQFSYDSLSWTPFDNDVTNSSHLPAPTENKVFYRVIADTVGCYDTSRVQAVNVNELVGEPTGISGSPTVCVGDTVILSAEVVPNATFYDFQLTNGYQIIPSPDPDNIEDGYFVFTSSGNANVQLTTLNGCGSSATSINFPINAHNYPEPQLSPLIDQTICKGQSVSLTYTENSSIPPTQLIVDWRRGNQSIGSNSTITAAQSGNYSVMVTNANAPQCKAKSEIVAINVEEVIVTSDEIIYVQKDQVKDIPTTSNGNWIYNWSPSSVFFDNTVLSPEFTTQQDFTATLTASSTNGCVGTTTTKVVVVSDVAVPNVFTPNNDGENDEWIIEGIELLDNLKIVIFNRWGNEVYRAENEFTAWDGTRNGQPLPIATYYYIIESPDLDKPINGSVTIIR